MECVPGQVIFGTAAQCDLPSRMCRGVQGCRATASCMRAMTPRAAANWHATAAAPHSRRSASPGLRLCTVLYCAVLPLYCRLLPGAL
jgi:hypothetical protein